MPTNDLDAITARAEAATEGPWYHSPGRSGGDGQFAFLGKSAGFVQTRAVIEPTGVRHDPDQFGSPCIAEPLRDADADFIAYAREDVPALVAEVRELRAWRFTVAFGLGYVEQHGAAVQIAPAQHIVDGVREATLAAPGWRGYCGRGVCALESGHRGPCDA